MGKNKKLETFIKHLSLATVALEMTATKKEQENAVAIAALNLALNDLGWESATFSTSKDAGTVSVVCAAADPKDLIKIRKAFARG
jgi:hypothetical protein